jgi:hypothetical protein
MPQGLREEGKFQKSLHQAQAEIYVSFDLMVLVAAEENSVMRFHLTCKNPNNPVPGPG